MAKQRSNSRSVRVEPELADGTQHASALERIARGISLLAIKGQRQDEQIELLSCIGYAPSEIASLIVTTPATVSQTLYMNRKKRSGKTNK
jgi:hypothetical protein